MVTWPCKSGLGKWTGFFIGPQLGRYKTERWQLKAKYQPLYDKYLKRDVKTVAADKEAQEMGKRLYQTCIQCHGADIYRGARGAEPDRQRLAVWRQP